MPTDADRLGMALNVPEGEAPTSVALARFEAAVAALPLFTRQVFLAHRIDDLSYAQIATKTGLSVRRIEREMARAIVGIERSLTKQERRSKWWSFRSALTNRLLWRRHA